MCIDLHVTLPTVESFLLLYSLKCGSVLVLIWTAVRSFFSLFFFIVVILEAFVKRSSPFGQLFVHDDNPTTDENVFHVFYCSIAMILAESFLFVFCYYLALGIYCSKCRPIPQYLICRFITWLVEITNLFVLTLVHKLLVGWYLGILLFIVIEFYGFIVVYSYYVDLCEEDCRTCKPACDL